MMTHVVCGPSGCPSEAEPAFRDFADRLVGGEGAAASELLARYSARLLAIARGRLGPRLAAKADAEDMLQSVLRTLFRRLSADEVELRDWSSLEGLLALLTLRKCQRLERRYFSPTRNVRREMSLHGDVTGGPAVRVPDREPTPDEAAAFADLLETFLASLDEDDRRVVELVLAGEPVESAAKRVGRSRRTAYRVLERSRRELLRLVERPEANL